jgi:hypothetical protein
MVQDEQLKRQVKLKSQGTAVKVKERTLHQILVKKNFIFPTRGLDMPVTRRTFEVVQLDGN